MPALFGYEFKNGELLRLALTHRSARTSHNERLEFLGDAVLGQVIANYLYTQFPKADEGALTRMRAQLVNRDALARIARHLGLGEHIVLGEGELKSGGWRRPSILSNTLEAILGAIYLDGGHAVCSTQIIRWFEPILNEVDPTRLAKDPKTRLQELLQSKGQGLPVYSAVEVNGPAHAQNFTVACSATGIEEPVTAVGRSRRAAEQNAAERVLEILQEARV